MTDAPPKKRPWFQLHLSTCVVLMFIAGALVGINIGTYHSIGRYEVYGFPQDAWIPDIGKDQQTFNPPFFGPSPYGIAWNAAFAVAILAATRERARAAQEPAP
ncbi:MAG: hypothetical protein L6R28_12680 [Planctomycetes bacterium]|nr:hypothetical protein [Planctomycetota bacterium]